MKVNHKSLKLGVAFALVSTVGITSAEIIKQELSKPIVAVEETTTTTTESPEKIKYKKEVQEFSKTMRPVVAKYGVTDEKLDELANKWVEKRIYQGYRDEFNDEVKKLFIEAVIDSTAHNFILNSLDKAIDIVQKANYFDSTQKEKWIAEMKEYKGDLKDGYPEDYPFHIRPYSRSRYYQDDRKDLLTNYSTILENTIQYVKEHYIDENTAKLYSHKLNHIFGYAEMKEEQEINQDSSLSDQQKKQLLAKIDDILEVKYVLGDNRVPFETINDIILEIRQVHINANGSEYEEPFSEEKVEKYIDRIVKEKTESKVKELSLNIKTQFEEYGNSQKTKALEEGISEEAFSSILKFSSEKASKNARYYYRMNKEAELNDILRDAKNEFQDRIQSLKAKNKVKEALTSYVNSKKQELEKYGVSNEKINEVITRSVDGFSFDIRRGQKFEEAVENLTNKSKEDFDSQIEPFKNKYVFKERLKEYAYSQKKELLKFGVTDEILNTELNKLISNLENYTNWYREPEELLNEVTKYFDYNMTPFKAKYEFKEFALSKQKEIEKYGINTEKNNTLISEIIEKLEVDSGRSEKKEEYFNRIFKSAKENYFRRVLEEVVKGRILEFEKQQIEIVSSDTRYTESELESEISIIKNRFRNRSGNLDLYLIQDYFKELFKMPNLSLQELTDKAVIYTQNKLSKFYYSAPVSKNKFTINNVALNEKLEINQDNSLSISEKLALQLKVDLLAEKAIKKMNQLSLRNPNIDNKPRAMTTEELAVFIEQIQNIHNAKVVNNANEVFKPKEEKIEKPLLEKPAPTQPIDNGATITEKPSVLPELKPVQPTETTSTIELKPVVSTEKEEKTTEVVSNKVETTKENEETTKEVVSRNKWEKKGNRWYYVDNDGKAVSKQWIGSYYIKADKTMAENEWIYDANYNSWFYFDENGHYVENTWKDQYYLKSGGYMAKNEWIFDSSYNSWYYLNEDGSYARNQWIQSNGKWYYVLSNGKMAKNTVIDGYQLNENGEWV
jgi:mannosyl-glycoprotein endo-beta-N-acetylglucosaminidase